VLLKMDPLYIDQVGEVSRGMKRGMSISEDDNDGVLSQEIRGALAADLMPNSQLERNPQSFEQKIDVDFPHQVDLTVTDFERLSNEESALTSKRLTRMETPNEIRVLKQEQFQQQQQGIDFPRPLNLFSSALEFTALPDSMGFGETVQAYMDSIAAPSPGPTLIVAPFHCTLHGAPEHQESPRRIEVLCGENGALRRPQLSGLEWMNEEEIEMAPITDVLRVHEWEYIQHIKNKAAECKDLANDEMEILGGKHEEGGNVFKVDKGIGDPWADRYRTPPGCLDNDARLTHQSFEAALYAAGGVLSAVDRVAQGRNANAFVVIRPPGHHAGPRGPVPSHKFWTDGMASTGFCLINNVAIGAAYARHHYGRKGGPLRKVAILDFDIHHGNGTEEVIRCLKPYTGYLPLPGGWPPQRWKSFKPWLNDSDSQNVFFCSMHLCQESREFFPGTGLEKDNQEDFPNILNIELKPLVQNIGNYNSKSRLNQTQKREMSRKASLEFRTKVQEVFLPKLQNFQPDILFLSSGFDGIISDFYHFLTPEDYTWLTNTLKQALEPFGGRIVSVLEGGYHLDNPTKSKNPTPTLRSRSPTSDLMSAAAGGNQIQKPTPAEKQPETLLLDTDGGLVQGVLSHVYALLTPLPQEGLSDTNPILGHASGQRTNFNQNK